MPFLILIAVCVAFLLYLWILDREKGKAYQRGFRDGKAANESSEDTFMRGVLWIQTADDSVEQTRKDLWRREYEEKRSKLWRESGAA